MHNLKHLLTINGKLLLGIPFLLITTIVSAQLSPLFVGDAFSQGGTCYQITDAVNSQSGAVWYDNVIDLNSDFDIVFDANFGSNDANGADGMVFVLKSTPDPVIGLLGGGIGYEGLDNTLAVEFDTWRNNERDDPAADHIAIISNGNNFHDAPNNLAGPINASSTSNNIEDGQFHEIKISWRVNTQTLSVIFDCDERLSYSEDFINTIFSGGSNVYFGFTGSTGGANNLQQLCFKSLSFVDIVLIEDQTICLGDSISTVSALYNSASSYSWSPTQGVSDPNIPNPVLSPTETTTYTVSIIDNCGEAVETSFTVNVIDGLTAQVEANPITICSGDDAVFVISGQPNTVVTYNINGGASQTVTLDVSGFANVTIPSVIIQQTINLTNVSTISSVINGNGLTASGGINPQNAEGEIDPIGTIADNSNCARLTQSVNTLSVILENTVPVGTNITISAAKNNANGDMTISDGSGTQVFNTGAEDILQQFVFTTTIQTNTITFSRNSGSCWIDGLEYTFEDDNCSEDIDESLTISILSSEFTLTPNCDGATATAELPGGVFSFNPVPTDGATIDVNTGTVTNVVPETNYTIEYTITGDCSSTSSQSFIAIAVPPFIIPTPLRICDESNNGFADFTLEDKNDEIINGQTNVEVSYYETLTDAEMPSSPLMSPYANTTAFNQTIFVRIEDTLSGCFSITTLDLVVSGIPEATLNLTNLCNGAVVPVEQSITPINFSLEDVIIEWYLDNNLLAGENGLSISVLDTGDYSVIITFIDSLCVANLDGVVTDDLNCIIPQGISPGNNDNLNDTFDLSGFNVTHIEIYNRYGTLVYKKGNYVDEWYGQSNKGDALPVGTYFYTMTYENGNKKHVGWVYIQR